MVDVNQIRTSLEDLNRQAVCLYTLIADISVEPEIKRIEASGKIQQLKTCVRSLCRLLQNKVK